MNRYLLAIYRLTSETGETTTTEIATALSVTRPSVTQRMKRLSEDGYVNYEWRASISLSETGKQIARLLLRKHRLLELFLFRVLDYPLPDLHAEVGRIEHCLSIGFMERVDHLLNHPQFDPHGHPIPYPDGSFPLVTCIPLLDMPIQTDCEICRVPDDDQATLSYLCEQGLVPDTRLQIISRSDVADVLTLQLETEVVAVSYALAETIGVDLVIK